MTPQPLAEGIEYLEPDAETVVFISERPDGTRGLLARARVDRDGWWCLKPSNKAGLQRFPNRDELIAFAAAAIKEFHGGSLPDYRD